LNLNLRLFHGALALAAMLLLYGIQFLHSRCPARLKELKLAPGTEMNKVNIDIQKSTLLTMYHMGI
jgi:hypothetical protein